MQKNGTILLNWLKTRENFGTEYSLKDGECIHLQMRKRTIKKLSDFERLHDTPSSQFQANYKKVLDSLRFQQRVVVLLEPYMSITFINQLTGNDMMTFTPI